MPLYTRLGDQGTTSLIGGKRVSKSDLIIEVLGTIDETDAVLGVARSVCKVPANCEIIYKIQKDLWLLMADIASAREEPGNNRKKIGEDHVLWLEGQIEDLAEYYEMPKNLLIPGDSYPAAMLDLARTIARRAERRMVSFCEITDFHNHFVLRYLNRLSSLCYALELREIYWKDE